MSELIHLLFHPLSNAIMTVLTGVTALYWLLTFIAGDFFGETGVEADIDAHGADIDTNSDSDLNDSVSDKPFLQRALEFVNVGKVPFMVVYSTFKFISWIITLTSSVILGAANWGWKSIFILIPIFFIGFIFTRYATKPLIKVYRNMGYNGEEAHELLGRTARMRSTISGNTIGAAELMIQSDKIQINVKSKTGEPLAYNSEVMIADESADRKYYLVVQEINLSNVV